MTSYASQSPWAGTIAFPRAQVRGREPSTQHISRWRIQLCANHGRANYRFGGKERDTETGNDNFGDAVLSLEPRSADVCGPEFCAAPSCLL